MTGIVIIASVVAVAVGWSLWRVATDPTLTIWPVVFAELGFIQIPVSGVIWHDHPALAVFTWAMGVFHCGLSVHLYRRPPPSPPTDDQTR
ncbi:hypothetical protein [Streptomyces sp. NPDC005438]|uniref:hypothetical protein n=1 Tax=Streptomyces sp. NPDC005438 TaxID=3156880 RepID=UPI0033ADA497